MNRILVLGASGMLGSQVLMELSKNLSLEVFGTVRNASSLDKFPAGIRSMLKTGVDIQDVDSLARVVCDCKPTVIINCVGVVKQLAAANDPLITIPINSVFPHRLLSIANLIGASVIHISTDCVFNGLKGMYKETDAPDANDLYGRSKYLGELSDNRNAITLRTSIIGHELFSSNSLVDWFLKQDKDVQGYSKAIFSGFPTCELANIILQYVVPNEDLFGLYHVSSSPISKYELLSLIKREYKTEINIHEDDKFTIDRSLDSERFRSVTGYKPPNWELLVKKMNNHKFF